MAEQDYRGALIAALMVAAWRMEMSPRDCAQALAHSFEGEKAPDWDEVQASMTRAWAQDISI